MSDFSMTELPDLSTFAKYKEKDELEFDDETKTDLVHAEFYEREVDGKMISVGIFSHNGKQLFCAWGYKDEEHCAMHAAMGEDGKWLTPEQGCPIKIAVKEGERNVGLRVPTMKGEREFSFSQ